MAESVFEQVYQLVLQIPRGRVMTYGQISRLLDERLSAQGVGWALGATPVDERRIPWHRVVNSKGGISSHRALRSHPNLQRVLLEEEGIEFDDSGRLSLERYLWIP